MTRFQILGNRAWEGVRVAGITYESSLSVLSFEAGDVLERLARSVQEFGVEEDVELLTWLKTETAENMTDFHIDEDRGPAEMVGRLAFVISDLLLDGRGAVWCKACGSEVPAGELIHRRRTPVNAGIGVSQKDLKRLSKDLGIKGRMKLPGMGGTRFFCGQGHEVFGTVEWVS